MPTKIEWATETWNPITGCSKISEGCRNCYAERMSKRLAGRYGYPKAPDNFKPTFHPERLSDPFKWKKPRRVFVCSMGDLFHDGVEYEWIRDVFHIMDIAREHTYMLLTKRPWSMKRFFDNSRNDLKTDYPHIWAGVTAENQLQADRRIPVLLGIPAAIHFVSVEPMLCSVDLESIDYGAPYPLKISALSGYFTNQKHVKIDWVICGAESGPRKRLMFLDWARYLRDQCLGAGVPFFFKKDSNGNHELDGRVWEELPK